MWGLLPSLGGAGGLGAAAARCACAGLRLASSGSGGWSSGSSSGGSSGGGGSGGGGGALQQALWSAAARRYHGSAGAAAGAGHVAVTHATTIIAVRKDGEVVVMGDGQATQDAFVVKANVTKVRRVGDGVIGGFAGRAADGLSLLERLEAKLEEHPGQLSRAAVELAKDWRQDRVLRHLEALLLVADARTTLWLSGNGDVIEAPDGVMGIGSGSDYAEAAARALLELPNQTAMGIGGGLAPAPPA
ncbi:ATP-dependent protease subunit [Raphidocelis subcapitata]|uniref:ATP-dependent protease subunit n=1 Tax=Raphidocelis subcapitata TaxID=307507 RepID=A0A2V0PE50_9CHLO|nr:ATP-dependent protease subunit [Raphidocelis subcapitata]|eukprot:GBF98131.1 ATP-dependent protease subunit [Raphidocelis subcapitata]